MNFTLALILALSSLSTYAKDGLRLEKFYFADHHVEAKSKREAKKLIDAEADCREVVQATFDNPYSLRINPQYKGKQIEGSILINAKVVRIFTEDASVKAFAPLCQLELIYE